VGAYFYREGRGGRGEEEMGEREFVLCPRKKKEKSAPTVLSAAH